MICDIAVPVHSVTSQPAWPAERYAISLAAIFGAHLTAVAPSFVQAVSGMLRTEIPAELIEEAERQADTAAQTAISSFEERAARRSASPGCGPARRTSRVRGRFRNQSKSI